MRELICKECGELLGKSLMMPGSVLEIKCNKCKKVIEFISIKTSDNENVQP